MGDFVKYRRYRIYIQLFTTHFFTNFYFRDAPKDYLSLDSLFLFNNLDSMRKLNSLNCYNRSDESYVSVTAFLRQNFPRLNINHFDLTIATPKQFFEPDLGFWDIEAKKISYLGNSAKAPNYCFPRRYEMLTKLLDIEERIEQSAVNLEQFRLENNSDNEDIPDLS